jgi:hypothetical protein
MGPVRVIPWVIVVTALGGPGCHLPLGQRARDVAAVQAARGAAGQVTTDQQLVAGELIEIRDDGLVVLAARELVLVSFQAITSATFEHLGQQYSLRGSRSPDAALRERLRLASRYPQGLSDEVAAELLRALGQPSLTRVER